MRRSELVKRIDRAAVDIATVQRDLPLTLTRLDEYRSGPRGSTFGPSVRSSAAGPSEVERNAFNTAGDPAAVKRQTLERCVVELAQITAELRLMVRP